MGRRHEIARMELLLYDTGMHGSHAILCDGCGQAADPAHIARRLKRLENMTRYRPIHVQALFLGAMSPAVDADYLYSAEGEFRGEGLALLQALGIEPSGRSVEAVLNEFQRRGFLLVHILDCPAQVAEPVSNHDVLSKRLAAASVRIRRSLKPKKLVLLGEALDPFVDRLSSELPGIEIVRPEKGSSFRLNHLGAGTLASALTTAAGASL